MSDLITFPNHLGKINLHQVAEYWWRKGAHWDNERGKAALVEEPPGLLERFVAWLFDMEPPAPTKREFVFLLDNFLPRSPALYIRLGSSREPVIIDCPNDRDAETQYHRLDKAMEHRSLCMILTNTEKA